VNTTNEQAVIEPDPSVITIAHVVYGLHTLAIVIGLTGTVTIIGSFIGSLPSIIAVILNYLKRSEARGTWVESHFRWQIRTFWFVLLWFLVALLLIFSVAGIVIGVPILIAITFWLVYRIVRGWLRLQDRRQMYVED
jgi:uncharacterized membrane protein